jgi:hypothetical protein
MACYSVCVYTAVIVEHEHHHGPAVLVRRPLQKTFQVHAKRRQVRGRQSLKPESAKCGKDSGVRVSYRNYKIPRVERFQ